MNEPCKMCGSVVRIRQTRLPGTLGVPQGEVVGTRACTSPTCGSNTGQMSLADVV